MSRFNLSEWALGHRSFVWFLMLLVVLAGALSYQRLGREEDPAFTIKTMIVQANWPGATVEEVTNQVTDRIERKLQELDALDFTKSYTTPGQTTVFVNLKDATPAREIRALWVQVRNMIGDIKGDLPANVQGPFFNDQFGDVFGTIYALTTDGLSFRQLRDYAEQTRTQVLKIPGAGRVELLGVQDEVVHLNFSTQHVAGLGLDPVLNMFTWISQIGTLGVLAMMTVTSLAVIVFFRREGHAGSPLVTLVLPILSGLVMAALFVYIFLNFGDLTGTTGGALGVILPSLIPLAAIVGYLLAARLERTDPARFARMGNNGN